MSHPIEDAVEVNDIGKQILQKAVGIWYNRRSRPINISGDLFLILPRDQVQLVRFLQLLEDWQAADLADELIKSGLGHGVRLFLRWLRQKKRLKPCRDLLVTAHDVLLAFIEVIFQ